MIAVTGATGFVGRSLCEALRHAGTAFRPLSRADAPGCIAVGDIGPDTAWGAALAGASTVVHLAARVHHRQEREASALDSYRRTNVAGTLRLARKAQACGVRRIVFVSSIKVNGERTEPGHPFHADDAPAPTDPYGISKLEAERELRALGAKTGLEVVVVRPPLVYGAEVGANFRALVDLARKGLPLPLGAIRNKRSLIAVGNLVDLLIRCVDHPQAAGRTFLCRDGQDVSTPELLRAIGLALGRPAQLVPAPALVIEAAGKLLGQGAAVRRLTDSLQVDDAETRACLDWTPPFTLGQALSLASSAWIRAA